MTYEEELKDRIKELEHEIKILTTNKKRNNLTQGIKQMPINVIRYDGNKHIVTADTTANDVWVLFRSIAYKLILHKIEWTGKNRYLIIPKDHVLLRDLTEQQTDIMTDFLNETIPIFNRYLKKMNKTIRIDGEDVNIWELLNIPL